MAKSKKKAKQKLDPIFEEQVLRDDVTRLRQVAGLVDKARSRLGSVEDEDLRGLIENILEEGAEISRRTADGKVEQVREMKLSEIDQRPEDYDYGSKSTKRLER